jgi:fructose-bisphosphate aldolase, class II
MPLLDGEQLRRVYAAARKGRYALPANNFADFNLLHGFLDGAEAVGADCVVQLSNGAADFLGRKDMKRGLRIAAKMVEELADSYSIGVALNLDHTRRDKTDFLRYACEKGLTTSVMIDASDLPFEENLAATEEVARFAHDAGILVEAELGKVLGEEDHIVGEDTGDNVYTVPEEAVDFVRRSGCDLLAVCIGTNHGVSKGKDTPLRIDVMERCQKAVQEAGLEVFFVLHGGSGIDEERVRQCIRHGVVKINKDTEYQFVYTQAAIREYEKIRDSVFHPDGGESPLAGRGSWTPDKKRFDPRPTLKTMRSVIARRTGDMIREGGSDGKSLFAKGASGRKEVAA